LPCKHEGQLDCDDEDADSATYCLPGYYLAVDGTCAPCDLSCKTCDDSGALACTTCWDDSTLGNDDGGDGEGLDDFTSSWGVCICNAGVRLTSYDGADTISLENHCRTGGCPSFWDYYIVDTDGDVDDINVNTVYSYDGLDNACYQVDDADSGFVLDLVDGGAAYDYTTDIYDLQSEFGR
jgi:hypothetical protein